MSAIAVDSPRAWGTVIGGFIANFVLGGLAKSYGIILEAYQDEFEAPTAYFTLTGGILYMLMFVLSLPNHFVVERIGHRVVVMIGGLCSCLSLLAAAAAPTVTLWAAAIGGGLGFSFACVYFNIFSVVGRCFRKRLGLANGLSVAGVSVGQMAFPSLVTFLLQTYGVRCGTIVMAAFCLHICVTAALMPKSVLNIVEDVKDELTISPESSSADVIKEEEFSMNANGDKIQISKKIPSHSEREEASLESISDVRTNLAIALLVVYIFGKTFADNGDVGISFVAPPYGTQMGFSSKITSLAIAVSGVVDLLSRLLFGFLTDRPFCVGKRGMFLALCWFVEAANAIVFSQLSLVSWSSEYAYRTNIVTQPSRALYWGYFTCFAVHGVCSGTAMTQMVVVLSDWVGPSRLARSLAIMMVILGIIYVPAQAVVGLLNDITGSYAWSIRLCGLWLLIAALIFSLEFPLRRWLLSPSPVSTALRKQRITAASVHTSNQASPCVIPLLGDQSPNQNIDAKHLVITPGEMAVSV